MSEARRAFLAAEWREVVAEDVAVKDAYPLAQEVVEESLFVSATDATTEATRRQTMRSVLRHRFEVVLEFNDDTEALDLGDVVEITHDRYSLSGGELFRVIGVEPDAERRRVTLQVWGPADPVSRTRAPTPSLSGTGTVPVGVTGSGGVTKLPVLSGTGTVT